MKRRWKTIGRRRLQLEWRLTGATQVTGDEDADGDRRRRIKTYCGYCSRVKKLLSDLGANYKVIELDVESDGDAIQSALIEWTGQKTVPNVFIGGNHVGGCDNVTAKHNGGQLVPLLTEAGAVAKAGGSS